MTIDTQAPNDPTTQDPASAAEPPRQAHALDISAEDLNLDHDELALRNAATEAAETQGEPAAASPAPAAAPRPGTPAAPVHAEPTMIPKERLDEVLRKAGKLAEENAYLRGLRDAQQPAPAGNAPVQEPQPDPVNTRIAELRTQRDAIEEAYENATITSKERRAKLDAIDDEVISLRVERIVDSRQIKPPKPEPSLVDEALETEHVTRLEDAHPHLKTLTDAQLNQLSRLAHVNAELEGKPFSESSRDNIRLRNAIADLSYAFKGKWWNAGTAQPAPNGKGQGQPAPGAAAPKVPSADAQARRTKIGLANNSPPDTRNLGVTRDASDGRLTDMDVIGMSDVELENLPAAERARLQ